MPRRRFHRQSASAIGRCCSCIALGVILHALAAAAFAESPKTEPPIANAASPASSVAEPHPSPNPTPTNDAAASASADAPASEAPSGFRARLAQFRSRLGIPNEPVELSSPLEEPVGGGETIWSADVSSIEGAAAEQPPKTLEQRLKELENEVKKNKEEEKKKKDADALKPTLKWSLELQNDYAFFSQTTKNRDTVGDMNDGADFRRVRIAALGDIFKRIEYRLEVDFALAGRPSFLDVWITAKDLPVLGNFRVGRFFEPFSLERLTSNRFVTFMERSLPDAFAPKRNVGMMAFRNWANDRGTIAMGVFRSSTDEYGNDVGDRGWAQTGRVTYLPWYDEASEGKYLWHVGGAYSNRQTSTERLIQYRERPEIRMTRFSGGDVPFFVDTGPIPANNIQLGNLETALILNSLSFQAEYTVAAVDRIGGGNPVFEGAYVETSFFLTGEHRNYRRSQDTFRRFEGVFDRIQPLTNALKDPTAPGAPRGPGAWEAALRWSTLNFNSEGINGNRLNDMTVGLNWYLNPYTRVYWNYILPFLDDAVDGPSTAGVYAMRFQFEF